LIDCGRYSGPSSSREASGAGAQRGSSILGSISGSGGLVGRFVAMDMAYPAQAEQFRAQVRVFLTANLPDGWAGMGKLDGLELAEFGVQWRKVLFENGYLAPDWPSEYGGGGLTAVEQVVLAEEFSRAGVPGGGPNDTFGIQMLGNTLLRWGTDEQKSHYLPRILAGDDTWCQGYSEPNAGSDLANVGTRAVLDGDQWVINGQKIWTSAGHLADHIFVLCRTDVDAPKHKGISFILVDMRQPGVEVRPIRMISGDSEFNEVFFTDAVTPKGEVIGGVNNGWAVAMTLLGFERGESAATLPIRFKADFERLVELAREYGKTDDPRIRQRLASAYISTRIMDFSGKRVLTKFLAGHHPGPDAAISKLFWSEYHRVETELAMDIMGAAAMTPTGRRPSSAFGADDVGAPNSTNSWAVTFLNARAGTIYAGSSQVQRNIIGEQVLGLPKEPKIEARS
jgi:alkylation response protein AidB-like acyl-CoA dehydrogenase